MQDEPLTPTQVLIDRVTVRMDAVFQSTDTQVIVPVSCSFDRVKECGDTASTNTVRLTPGKKVQIPGIPGAESTLFRWFIVHKIMNFTDFDMMVNAKANVVNVVDSTGALVSVVPSNEVATIVHPGPLFAVTESVACSLQNTVFPY